MSTALIVRDGFNVSLSSFANTLKESTLAGAALVGRVSNAEEQAKAVSVQQEIAYLLRQLETARKEAKEPGLEFCRNIDATAKAFRQDLEAEQMRISKLTGDFQALEMARVRSEQAAQMAELTRLEKERESELAKATTHEKREAIHEQYGQLAATLPVVAPPVRAEGQIAREDWDIEVFDPLALAKAFPQCVNIEPRILDIRRLLDGGIRLPGVKAEKVWKSGVRVQREAKAIDV